MKYRYKGLIITDDLKMKAIRFLYGSTLAIKKAFLAGNDIVIFRFNRKEEKESINQIISLVKKNKIKLSRINRSVRKIINIKEKYDISDYNKTIGIDIDKINEEIQEIRNKVL